MSESPSPEVAKERDAAYDLIDRFLRNNLDDTDYAEYSAALETVLASTAAKADAGEWQPIETAPKYTEVLVWREDSGPFIAKLTTPDAVITPEEMERENLEFPDDFEEWYSDAYGWQEGSERPTHWQQLPASPKTNGGMGS